MPARTARVGHAAGAAADLPAGDHPTPGTRRGRVLLLAGCAQRVLQPSINAATVRMLHRAGYDVTVAPRAGCCGSLALHMGREAQALAEARRNVDAWGAALADGEVAAIVVNASGCGSTVKDYGRLLRGDSVRRERAARIAGLARDVCEFLAAVALDEPPAPRRHVVAVHDPCSLRNVQRVTDAPRALLRRGGFVTREIAEAHFCCGSAGTYNLLQPDIARRLGERKAAHAAGTDAAIVAAANIGCVVQIARYSDRPVVHPVELLDWAWGGPCPPALAGRTLPDAPDEPRVVAWLGTAPAPQGPGAPAPGAPPDRGAPGIW